MGLENMAFLMYDSRATYADMVDTLAELACWSIDQIFVGNAQKVTQGNV